MKKAVTLFIVFACCTGYLFAQQGDSVKYNPYIKQKKESPVANKLYYGGSLGFTFGSYTSVSIWPMVGYKATPKLSFGLQPGYEYLKYKNYYNSTFETSNYGLRVFSRYRVIPQAYAHVEYASINYGIPSQMPGGDIVTTRTWVPFLFVGGGLSQHIGGNAWAYAQILFDVINSDKSPYRSGEPFWSIGISAGF